MTDDEIAELRASIKAQRQDVREDLADDLGGEPEDYNAEEYLADRTGDPVADGGE